MLWTAGAVLWTAETVLWTAGAVLWIGRTDGAVGNRGGVVDSRDGAVGSRGGAVDSRKRRTKAGELLFAPPTRALAPNLRSPAGQTARTTSAGGANSPDHVSWRGKQPGPRQLAGQTARTTSAGGANSPDHVTPAASPAGQTARTTSAGGANSPDHVSRRGKQTGYVRWRGKRGQRGPRRVGAADGRGLEHWGHATVRPARRRSCPEQWASARVGAGRRGASTFRRVRPHPVLHHPVWVLRLQHLHRGGVGRRGQRRLRQPEHVGRHVARRGQTRP